jgi:hypothetical protein
MVISRLPQCDLDDVVHSVRPVDIDRLENLLDPAREWELRANFSMKEFRLLQRKRIHELLEIMRRICHNAGILAQWGAYVSEFERYNRLARQLHERAVEVRVCASFAIAKLRMWIVLRADTWPLLPRPSLPGLRNNAGIDTVIAYSALKELAGTLCSNMDNRDSDELRHRL